MRALLWTAVSAITRPFRRRPSLVRLNRLAQNLQHALRVGDCSEIQRAQQRYETELRRLPQLRPTATTP